MNAMFQGEHGAAIIQHLTPLLLSLLCGLAGWAIRLHARFLSRHERDHERLEAITHNHDQRLTRVESGLEHAERELNHIREELR